MHWSSAASKLTVPDKVVLKDAGRIHPDRNARQADRHAREGERQGQVRHRRDGAGNEVRDRRRMSRCSAAKVKSVDDSKTLAIAGVRQVVRIDNAVAVVGDNMWAAMQGLAGP